LASPLSDIYPSLRTRVRVSQFSSGDEEEKGERKVRV
jgi:hypothetical protein